MKKANETISTGLLCAIVALVTTVNSAEAKTLYVDRNAGNDAVSYDANSPTSPWASIGRAAWGSTSRNAPDGSQAARAGDTVIVRAGTYSGPGTGLRFEILYNPANSGAPGQPIVFQGEGTVVLTLSSGSGPVIGARDRSYITWRNFTINEANAPQAQEDSALVVVQSDTQSRAVGNVLEGLTLTGIVANHSSNHSGIRLEGDSGTIVRNSRIAGFQAVSGPNSSGIVTYWNSGQIFENNEFVNNGNGIFEKAPTVNVATTHIRYNIFAGNQASGVRVHRSPHTSSAPVLIYQNVFRDSRAGVLIQVFDQGSTDPANAKIVNNVFYNVTFGLESTGNLVPNARFLFWNNIVSASQEYAISLGGAVSNLTTDKLSVENNIYHAYRTFSLVYTSAYSMASFRSTFSQDLTSRETDPQFLNPGGGDFRLGSGSPARNGGVDVLDLNRNGSTNDGVALGPYITGNETIGRGSSGGGSALTAPTNLRVTPQ